MKANPPLHQHVSNIKVEGSRRAMTLKSSITSTATSVMTRCVCVCVCVCVCGSSLVQLLQSWATNPRVGGSNPGLGLAVVTLSKSLYLHYSSVPTCSYKIGTWSWLGWQKGQKHQSHWQCQNLVRSRLDFGCQHHTSGAINELLWVPSLAPGIMPNVLAHSATV